MLIEKANNMQVVDIRRLETLMVVVLCCVWITCKTAHSAGIL